MNQAASVSPACEARDQASPRHPPDGELARRVLDGDIEAGTLLFDRYIRFVHAMCYDMVGNLDRSHDLAQEVMLRACRDLRRLRNPDAFGPWLRAIAKRTCLDWKRRRARSRQLEGDVTEVAAPPDDPDSKLEELNQLHAAIATLPEKERAALHLFYLQEQSADDARATLGLSRSGFYRVLTRAHDRLRKLLRRDRRVIP